MLRLLVKHKSGPIQGHREGCLLKARRWGLGGCVSCGGLLTVQAPWQISLCRSARLSPPPACPRNQPAGLADLLRDHSCEASAAAADLRNLDLLGGPWADLCVSVRYSRRRLWSHSGLAGFPGRPGGFGLVLASVVHPPCANMTVVCA